MSTRRDFIRRSALATAAAAAGRPLTGTNGNLATLKWDRASIRPTRHVQGHGLRQ